MRTYPSLPHVDDAPPGLLDGGHLWLQELVDGAQLRVQLRSSGAVRFGDSERVFDDDEIPRLYRHAVRHVRERLDREALLGAVDDPESVVLFTEATVFRSIEYDWDRTPSVLGFDVYDADREAFLPPDAAERVFDRLGLEAVNTFEREVRAVDFRPDDYSIPGSAWRDGPAAGVVVRDKTGGRAMLPNPDVDRGSTPDALEGIVEKSREESATEPLEESAEQLAEKLAEQLATDELLGRVASELGSAAGYVSFDPLFERTMEAIYREAGSRLLTDRNATGADGFRVAVDPGELRAAIAARTRAWLDARGSNQ